MSAETCIRSQCPEMPKVTLDQAVIDLMESIALQETALSHILCAESQKMKVAMGLDGLPVQEYEYNYRINGKIVQDPYAASIWGREIWGKEVEEEEQRIPLPK